MMEVRQNDDRLLVHKTQGRRKFLKSTVGVGLTLRSARDLRAFAAAGNPKRTMRVALVGSDGHVGIVLGTIARMADVELVAIAKSLPDDDVSKLKRNQAFTDRTHIYDTYEPLFENEQLDVICVCMPYYRNAEVSIAAAQRGIHIVSEKPVATTRADLNALRRAVSAAGVRLTTLLNMRCFPPYLAARKVVRKGLIGEPILMTSQKSYKFGASRPWFYKKAGTYGGSIPWAGIHAIDYMHWTSGRKYTRVSAWQGNKAHPDYPGFQDHGGVLLQMDNGGTAMCNIDYLRPESAPTHGDDRLRIAGSEGVVEVMGAAGRVTVMTNSQPPRPVEQPEPIDFFADYLEELWGRGQHIVSQADAFRMTEVCLKARDAAQSHQWVAL